MYPDQDGSKNDPAYLEAVDTHSAEFSGSIYNGRNSVLRARGYRISTRARSQAVEFPRSVPRKRAHRA